MDVTLQRATIDELEEEYLEEIEIGSIS